MSRGGPGALEAGRVPIVDQASPPGVREKCERLRVSFLGVPAFVNVRIQRSPHARGTVICASGLAASGAEFCILATRLARIGFDVIYPDWLGHGDSDYPDQEGAYDWGRYVKTLGIVNRVYGGPGTHFLGVSWGAAIAFLLLLSNPIAPRSAVFVDLPVRFHPETVRAYERLLRQCEARFDSIEDAERFLYSYRPELNRVPDSMRGYYRDARFVQRDGKVAFKCDPRSVRAVMRHVDRRLNLAGNMRRITFNSLFLYGLRSPYRDPKAFSAACGGMPNISYADDLDAAHPPTLLTPEDILPIENFFAQQHP